MTSSRIEHGPRHEDIAGPPLQVVATAGHVDHGKSSLILRLTGMDPDRWAEEKRRGLTIDLGFAWCELPSGREIGFVDVPGHERFVRNMLAGMGPVRLVLFVVAADEGWKPQSEEHLAIIDVLGAHGGVVALTKRDLVDAEALVLAQELVRDRLQGTALEASPIVACSSATGEGLDELLHAMDEMVASAPTPEGSGRPRLFIDRIFTIKGAGTIVTGTLTGGRLSTGQEIALSPTGARARIRSLQSHKRSIDQARPVSRVAANLVGVDRADLARGDVLGLPGEWRPTRVFEARIRPVRALDHPLTGRGAYKLYAGSAERDARLRFYGTTQLTAPGRLLARIRLSAPLVLDVHDRFVLREAGRRETVAGGVVLDTEPPSRAGSSPEKRLAARERAIREELPTLLVAERGAVRASDVSVLTGRVPGAMSGLVRVGAWWSRPELHSDVSAAVSDALSRFHSAHPLLEGAELATVRSTIEDALVHRAVPAGADLVDALLEDLSARGVLIREGRLVRLASHRVTLAGREDEVERLLKAVVGGEPTPPTVSDLVALGFAEEIIEAACHAGSLVRVSQELVMAPSFVQQAESVVRQAGETGLTVSAFRERLGTSRKYALPLLEHFDQAGLTRRQGDVRVVRKGP